MLSNPALGTIYNELRESSCKCTLWSEIDRYLVQREGVFRPVERDEGIMYTGQIFGYGHPACLVSVPNIDAGGRGTPCLAALLGLVHRFDSIQWEVIGGGKG